MAFISYAQNFEDVMLWRALKHIGTGFYIDIGAMSPDVDSVTRAFYEHGWWGINVEPNPRFHAELLADRTRDINLLIATSEKTGKLIMNFLSDLGLSTLDENLAHNYASKGWKIDKQEVEVTTLAALWRQHVPEDQDVHFLKVDVEGFEEAVLRGNEWSKYRPWIVVVESTRPMSQQESHGAWEPILHTAGYRFSYADGLNRFYVANEHVELLSAFNYPPNVFDDFMLNSQYQAEIRAQQAEIRAQQAEIRAQQLHTVADGLNRELQVVYASRSWRITRPLRAAFCALRQVRMRFPHMPWDLSWDLKDDIRGLTGSILARLINFSLAHPQIKMGALALLRRSPALDAWLRRFAAARGITAIQASSSVPCKRPSGPSSLTPSARRVYFDLKAAIEQQEKGEH